jgi:hypothetical protein
VKSNGAIDGTDLVPDAIGAEEIPHKTASADDPERDTTPMATMALRSRLAARGIASMGRPSTRWR